MKILKSLFCKSKFYGSTPTYPHRPKKMDPLFLGVSYVIPRCVLWVSGREPTGTYDRTSKRKEIHKIPDL
jgi:hypothetical protein